ncbi:MAG: L-histidine N(alpha)-methyltransferase, partial [Bacteroidota bacterium]
MSRAARPLTLEADVDATEEFRSAVIAGLSGPRKQIPSKFFYDSEGSRLFQRICELDEYYLT